jgi:hypothetical protein
VLEAAVSDYESVRRQIADLDPDDRVALARWLVDSLPAGVTLLSERSTLVDLELQRAEVPAAIPAARR